MDVVANHPCIVATFKWISIIFIIESMIFQLNSNVSEGFILKDLNLKCPFLYLFNECSRLSFKRILIVLVIESVIF